MSSAPAGYPATWETDVALADGSTVAVRPIRPDDGPRLVAFHGRQSSQSIYFRYFSPRPQLSARDVEHLTTVDYVDRMALIALRDDELVGVARYDRWKHRAEAEVAFFVDDEHHGRGIATLLLEHLAARAREVGLSAFTASVLPENRRMISVFTQAGFEANSRFADGVVEVRLDLQPTPEAEAAIETRARRAAAATVEQLLCPRSVAVIGVSREPGGVGHGVFRNLVSAGFEGPVWPVHPRVSEVAGVPTVASILDIEEEVDLAVVAVPAAAVAGVLEECGAKEVRDVVVMSAGFAEQGEAGAALEADVLRVIRRFGMRLLGPASLGLVNTDPAVRLHATFARLAPEPGRFALLSESGMVGAAIVDQAVELGLGLSSFVALGNRADVSGNDLLQYWESDERTSVVGMYIESFGNPRRFSRIARRLARAKPVVAVRAGLGSGRRGDDTADVLLEQTGVIRVRTLTQLLDVARMLVHQPLPAGRRVAIVGNAGGSLAIAADACLDAGLELATLAEPTRAVLSSLVPPSPRPFTNPVDVGLQASGAVLEQAVTALADDPGVDAVLSLFAPALGGTALEAGDALLAAAAHAPRTPIAACFYGRVPPGVARDSARVVPVYRGVDSAALALGRAAAYSRWCSRPEGAPLSLEDAVVGRAQAVVSAALARRGRGPLDLEERARLLAAIDAVVVPSALVADIDEAVATGDMLGWPLALKAAGRERLAKTVAAGVGLDLPDAAALRQAWALMDERLEGQVAPALVQAMVEPGVDVAVRVVPHPIVGPVMTLKSGGVAGALDPASDLQVLPVSDLDAARIVDASHLAEVLDAPSRAQLVDLLLRVSALAEQVPEVVSLSLDPVIVRPDGATIIDTTIEVAVRERDPLPPVRRL